jgi:hypothetical protein
MPVKRCHGETFHAFHEKQKGHSPTSRKVAFTLGFYGGHDGTRTRDLYRVICMKTSILLVFPRF